MKNRQNQDPIWPCSGLNPYQFVLKSPDPDQSLEMWTKADLEKVASGACGHFVLNPAILSTLWFKTPAFLTKNGGRRMEGEKLRMDQWELRLYDGE